MTDKFKKVEKEYILSDSTVNCYGYRLLTSGYQLADFAKNPIGYYMHDREGGVVVRWEDLRIEGDQVIGKPCINLSNERGQQTYEEAMNGFLNAASVGHIVVLEYTNDADKMLEGQTGPTVLKWVNRECSLVDIPGNSNALTSLYDNEGNSLELADLTAPNPLNKDNLNKADMKEVILNVQDLAALTAKGYKITDLPSLLATLDDLKAQADKVPVLETQIKDLKAAEVAKEVGSLLNDALTAKKITVAMGTQLAADYATNPTGLKKLLDLQTPYNSVTAQINQHLSAADDTKQYEGKSWGQLMEGNLLPKMKELHFDLYAAAYKAEFGSEPPAEK